MILDQQFLIQNSEEWCGQGIHHVVMHTNYNWVTWSCHNYFFALQTGDKVWCISTCTTYYNNTDIHEWYSTIIHRADHAGQFFAIATWSIYNFFQNPCMHHFQKLGIGKLIEMMVYSIIGDWVLHLTTIPPAMQLP